MGKPLGGPAVLVVFEDEGDEYFSARAAFVTMERSYVEQDDTGYRIVGTRVSLESVVVAFREGWSPETIAGECFPTLTLEQVYGAIAYYLAHRTDIDAYLERVEATHEEERTAHEDPSRAT